MTVISTLKCLTCPDSTCVVLLLQAPFKQQLEAMLIQYILPCFDSPHGHLRAKACWVSGVYCDIDFAEGHGSGANYGQLFQRVINGLHDADLPVRVDAVVSLRSFVDELADLNPLKPILPSMLDRIFALMNEVSSANSVWLALGRIQCVVRAVYDHAWGHASAASAAFVRTRSIALPVVVGVVCTVHISHISQQLSMCCAGVVSRWIMRRWCSLWRALLRSLTMRLHLMLSTCVDS